MDIQYYGANCIRITTKKASVVIDDNLASIGLKTQTKPQDILLRTSELSPKHDAKFTADMPGEYEISGVVIEGVAVRGHMDEPGTKNSVIFKVSADDITVVISGHIYPDLNEEDLETLGMVDILMVPVGGHGYTLDSIGALKLIKKIDPKVVVPTHYADKAIKYEVPQQDLETAIKELGMEPTESLARYKPKLSELSDTTKLVVLERQP